MDIYAPGNFDFAALYPDRPSGLEYSRAVGQETHLTLDIDGTGAFTLVELVYEKPERNNVGRHGGSGSGLDVAGIHLPLGGAATVTIAYSGPRIPFTLRATVNGTDTDYDMGTSNDSQAINVPAGKILSNLYAIRRF
jgi:hypothetical protein